MSWRGAVPGRHALRVLGVGHFVFVDPVGVQGNRVQGQFIGITRIATVVVGVAAHLEAAGGDVDHFARDDRPVISGETPESGSAAVGVGGSRAVGGPRLPVIGGVHTQGADGSLAGGPGADPVRAGVVVGRVVAVGVAGRPAAVRPIQSQAGGLAWGTDGRRNFVERTRQGSAATRW